MMSTPILGIAEARSDQAGVWAVEKGAPWWFGWELPLIYWELAPLHGIRPEVAFAQAAHETGFGKFGRAVTREHNNYCGLKTRTPGGDADPNSHARFPTPEVGVIAHLEHIGIYAAAPGYPKKNPVDPRHFDFIHGAARTVEQWSTRWAPSETYHEKIVTFIDQIKASKGLGS